MSRVSLSLRALRAAAALIGVVLPLATFATECVNPGEWIRPGTSAALATQDVVDTLAKRRVVLLGEAHDQADHHRWQLHMTAALHARAPKLVLAFEMFPRSVQPALDDWVAGKLTEKQFLEASRWSEVWGLDPKLYMPLFDFARIHRIPMVAANVARDLVRRTGSEGWAAIPKPDREGVGDPAPAQPAYLEMLFESFAMHRQSDGGPASAPADAKPGANDLRSPEFQRFVESMQLWDRAMAEAIAARAAQPGTVVVGITGSGHLRRGFGVPHQLHALGIADPAVLLPWEANDDCDELTAGVADYVFGIRNSAEAAGERPRLGVMLDQGDRGVAIREVVKGSVAEQAGAQAGDIIEVIAGLPVKQTGDVVEVVQRQAPGTWLPLTVQRAGQSLELVARFPTAK